MLLLEEVVWAFGKAIERIDATRPVARNARSGIAYQPGIGPFPEKAATELIAKELPHLVSTEPQVELEVPYPGNRGSKCDLVIKHEASSRWAIEINVLRLLGDNGKVNDNSISHILPPYPRHHSALTDRDKLASAPLAARKAVLILGSDYDSGIAERPRLPLRA